MLVFFTHLIFSHHNSVSREAVVICSFSFVSLFLIVILFQERLLCYLSFFIRFIISHHNSVSRESFGMLFIPRECEPPQR